MGENTYFSSGHNGLGLLQHEIPEQCVENGEEDAVAKCGDCEDLSLCMFVADMSYLIMEETRSYISSPSTDMIFGSSGYATYQNCFYILGTYSITEFSNCKVISTFI